MPLNRFGVAPRAGRRSQLWLLFGLCELWGCAAEEAGPPPQLRDAAVLDAAQPGCEAARIEAFDITSARHVDNPSYPDPPPVGGDHKPCWAPYQVYEEPLPAGNWVHNLEHGAVVLLHNCDVGCDADVEAMARFASVNERTIVTPYRDLPVRFAVVAWGVRLLMDCYDAAATEAFYKEHFNHAPEDVGSGPPDGC